MATWRGFISYRGDVASCSIHRVSILGDTVVGNACGLGGQVTPLADILSHTVLSHICTSRENRIANARFAPRTKIFSMQFTGGK